MPVRNALQIPTSLARHRWAATIKAGIDLEDVLGINQDFANAALAGAALAGRLQDALKSLKSVGTIESLDFVQNRKIKQRFALGPNSLNSFQNVPQQIDYTIRLSRVVLKQLPEVEAAFNFLPSNLFHQQLPFVIDLLDAGGGTVETEIRHLLFGCWFTDSSVRYDATSRDDSRLIQTATINANSVLTFDQSTGGSVVTPLASLGLSVVQDAISGTVAEDLINDLNIA